MTPEEFKNKYDGKYIDFDGLFSFQCKDVFSYYNQEVVGNSGYVWGDAWALYDNAPSEFYDKFLNTPDFIPVEGDVAIWEKTFGGYGHVAIVCKGSTGNKLIVFGQNYPLITKFDSNGKVVSNGSPCHVVEMSYLKVKGFLRPKGINMVSQEEYDRVTNLFYEANKKLEEAYGRITSLNSDIESLKKQLAEKPKEIIVNKTIIKDNPEQAKTIKALEADIKDIELVKTDLMAKVGELSKPLTEKQKKEITVSYISNIIKTMLPRIISKFKKEQK